MVEVDEKLMEKYLEQGEIEPEALHAPFEKALREGHLIPGVLHFRQERRGGGGAARRVREARAQRDRGQRAAVPEGRGRGGAGVLRGAGAKAHVLAHVFKVVIDPFVGKVGIFRVHQGTMTPNSQLFIGSGKRPFKAGHLFAIQGKDYVETDALVPGTSAR